MRQAIRACLDYAEHHQNANAKRIGDLIQVSEWTIYKWMSKGSIPSERIPPFELACGCHYITEYLGHTAQKLLVDIPRGKTASQDDLLSLQEQLNRAINRLTAFYRDDIEAADALSAVSDAMSSLAGHRQNVVKHQAPELALFEENPE
ncbi:hypothetical protein [Salinisphaera hydrothermalis]|uniref:hypothetical protein n=1 Tax=Salinisphaera hydrothermalis TaxID=563188 RepID=UPI003342A014